VIRPPLCNSCSDRCFQPPPPANDYQTTIIL
jgi:hypothetical protein